MNSDQHLFNLQLFGGDGADGGQPDGNGQTGEQNNNPAGNKDTPHAQNPSPTFDDMLKQPGFQAEFERRVGKAIETAKGKFTDPRVDGLQKQLDGYMRREAVIKADVDPKFARFVTSEVTEAMAEGESFEEKLAAYLKDNPQYLRAPEPEPGKAWGRRMQGGDDGGADGVEAAFKALNPSLKID